MKKLLSLLLAILLLISAAAVMPVGASAEAAFQEGDELYLKIESPSNWADNATLYVNFTDATRAENNNSSIIIANADPTRYAPVTGVVYDGDKGLYKYTVTAANAGATVMRFWRGNNEKLWNESVAITADDLADGKNTAVVTDWTNTGYLTSTYDFELDAMMGVSSNTGTVEDPFEITMFQNDPPEGAVLTRELYINDVLVSEMELDTYLFLPEADGVYVIKGVFTVRDGNGRIIAKDTKTDTIIVGTPPVTALEPNCLYAHAAVDNAKDSEAWVKWYKIDDVYWFFMPSSAKVFDAVELYSTFTDDSLLEETVIPANSVATYPAEQGKTYRFIIGDQDNFKNIRFMFSSAEAALWVNNTDSFDGYGDFFTYLQADKANSVAASGAVSTPNGKIENTPVKKMKGRGNTSWNADKKGFNVTLQDTIKLAGMDKCKKFSLVSNFQDAAMARNRILFDLADEVGVPYSSDSRFIDLYTNGVYQGTYQMCQKIDVGKNTLISDFSDDDYLDKDTGGVKSDFCFVTEIDSSPAADDFHFTVNNGNNLTMKAPELADDDPNYNAVRNYIRNKFNTMYNSITSDNINDYIDVNSLAKVYLINELGKNWDSGASSFYFTYKPDENGVYKFFASPVWDYDNSLGNARGVSNELNRMGISDYELPSGWFSTKKNGYNGPNFLAEAVKNSVVMDEVRRVWFEDFLPAIAKLNTSGNSSGEIYSSDVYADILRDSAAMNYKIWELVTNSSWIGDHGSLTKYSAAYARNDFGQVTGVTLRRDNSATRYDQYTFDGQFDYMIDWLNSRAAWISSQYIGDYEPSEPDYILGDVDFDEDITITDVTLIQRFDIELTQFTDLQKKAGDVNRDDDTNIIDATLIQRYLLGIIDHF